MRTCPVALYDVVEMLQVIDNAAMLATWVSDAGYMISLLQEYRVDLPFFNKGKMGPRGPSHQLDYLVEERAEVRLRQTGTQKQQGRLAKHLRETTTEMYFAIRSPPILRVSDYQLSCQGLGIAVSLSQLAKVVVAWHQETLQRPDYLAGRESEVLHYIVTVRAGSAEDLRPWAGRACRLEARALRPAGRCHRSLWCRLVASTSSRELLFAAEQSCLPCRLACRLPVRWLPLCDRHPSSAIAAWRRRPAR